MKHILMLCLALFSCNSTLTENKPAISFAMIDYSYDSGWKKAYSLKILASGEYFFGDGRWTPIYSIGQLKPKEIKEIDSLIRTISFNQFDSTYSEDKVDQSSFKLVVINPNHDTISKYVYGSNAPAQLTEISNSLKTMRDSIKTTIRIDTVIYFLSRRGFFK